MKIFRKQNQLEEKLSHDFLEGQQESVKIICDENLYLKGLILKQYYSLYVISELLNEENIKDKSIHSVIDSAMDKCKKVM